MHREWYELAPDTADRINRTHREGHRVIAVGTTSLRVLETCAREDRTVAPGTGWTDLFCYPPYTFRAVDVLLTNFHLPRSTLLALIMAFAGVDLTRQAYRHAIDREYRFFSYGDAMLIL
jgi:S-adenosylmethionine:tRNA ribosyltransferase-isomerase